MESIVCNGVTFSVGDEVRVVKTVAPYCKDGMGEGKKWDAHWHARMDDCVGHTFVIGAIDDSYGVFPKACSYPEAERQGVDMDWSFPLTALENLSTKPKTTFQLEPFMRVVCEDDKDGDITQYIVAREENGTLIGVRASGHNSLRFERDRDWGHQFIIKEVYAAPCTDSLLNPTARGKLLWSKAQEEAKAARKTRIKELEAEKARIETEIVKLKEEV